MRTLFYALLSLLCLFSCESDKTSNTEFQKNNKNLILASDYGKLHNEAVLYILENETGEKSDDTHQLLKMIENGLKTKYPDLFDDFDTKQIERLFEDNKLRSSFNYPVFYNTLLEEATNNGLNPILKDFLTRGYHQEYTDLDQEIAVVESRLSNPRDKENFEIFKSVLHASRELWGVKKNNQLNKVKCDPQQQVIFADAAAAILVGIYCPPCGVAAGAAASLLVSEAQNEEHDGGCIK